MIRAVEKMIETDTRARGDPPVAASARASVMPCPSVHTAAHQGEPYGAAARSGAESRTGTIWGWSSLAVVTVPRPRARSTAWLRMPAMQ